MLAENGIRVCIHGAEGHTAGRVYTSEVLAPLGINVANTLDEAVEHINDKNFCYMPLQTISTRLKDIIELRPFLGLRSPIHTVGRMINPLHAPYSIQAIFHPGYQKVHQQAAQIMGESRLAVFKGEAGEVERNPDTECTVSSVYGTQMSDELWPPLFDKRHMKEESLVPQRLASVWRGEETHEYGEAAIISTAAIALRLMGKADSPADAMEKAGAVWLKRDKSRH